MNMVLSLPQFENYLPVLRKLLVELSNNSFSLEIKVLLIKEDGKLYLLYGQILPISFDKNFEKVRLDYDNCIYIHDSIPPNNIERWFEGIFSAFFDEIDSLAGIVNEYFNEEHTFRILPDISISSRSPIINRYSSSHSNFRLINNPLRLPIVYSFNFMNIQRSYTMSPVTTRNKSLDYYPQLDKLFFHKFGFKLEENNKFMNRINIFLISPKGHNDKTITKNDRVYVLIKNKSDNSLTVKVFCETFEGKIKTAIYTVKNSSFNCPLEPDIKNAEIILVDNERSLLDNKKYNFDKTSQLEKIRKRIRSGE